MNFEIEAKMHLADLQAMERLLAELSAQFAHSLIQSDLFFDRPQNALRDQDQGLRIRRQRDPQDSDWSHIEFTYKGARQPGPLKQREEIEFSVSDAQAGQAFLERLGFAPGICVEKHRRSWRLDSCNIELDDVKGLGQFIEIEGPNEPTVMAVRKKLNLESEPLIREGYALLLIHSATDYPTP